VLSADTILYATGRRPNTEGLGLAELDVRLTPDGAVVVDEHYRSSVPTIHALGDVIDRVQLTPVALAEAMALVDRLFGEGRRRVDYELIPTAVFTDPNIGTVGLTEAAARERFGDVRVFRSEFKALKHTLSGSSERTLMKLVVDAASDRVVGLHMVGADAGEIVQGLRRGTEGPAQRRRSSMQPSVSTRPRRRSSWTMREPSMA
jgi:glutathione reductase (NADPH)